jgi:adenosylcobinamide-GDP ribazoletransferase
MHEDGLADTFDGLGAGRSREMRLDIMRDSRLGAYGVLALVGNGILKVSALAAIGISPWHGAVAIVLAAVASRAMALWHWHATMPSRWDGMAWAAGRPDSLAFALGLGTGLLAGLIMLVAFGWTALIGILMAVLGVVVLSSLADRRLGGHTGDTIGAAQQVAEALIFAGLSVGGTTIVL